MILQPYPRIVYKSVDKLYGYRTVSTYSLHTWLPQDNRVRFKKKKTLKQ